MILVDRRIGSRDLVEQKLLPVGECLLTDLEFADAAFCGNGPDPSRPPLIGIERKRLSDALACMDDGRFAGTQLRGLVDTYDVVWLLIEDDFRGNPRTGVLEKRLTGTWKGKKQSTRWAPASFRSARQIMWRDFMHWLTSVTRKPAMETGKQVNYWTTADAKETGRWIWTEYTWWSKPWARHKSCDVFDTSRDRPPAGRGLTTPPQVARHARALDDVGWDRALALSDAFSSPRKLANATYEELIEVDGIGEILARSIVEQYGRERKLPVRRGGKR